MRPVQHDRFILLRVPCKIRIFAQNQGANEDLTAAI
jgi:hypothetical protein